MMPPSRRQLQPPVLAYALRAPVAMVAPSCPPAAPLPTVPPHQHGYRWAMLGGVWLIYFGFGLLSLAMAPLVDPHQPRSRPQLHDHGRHPGRVAAGLYRGGRALRGLSSTVWGSSARSSWPPSSSPHRAGCASSPSTRVSMFVAVGLFGIGGPLVSIGAPKAIAQWFEGPERGFALGVYITGPFLGHILALVLTNSVLMPLLDGNWRAGPADLFRPHPRRRRRLVPAGEPPDQPRGRAGRAPPRDHRGPACGLPLRCCACRAFRSSWR